MPDELWMIEAIIQPHRLDPVTRALEDVDGFRGMTVSECRGFGQERLRTLAAGDHADAGSATARHVYDSDITDFTAKVKVECVVEGRSIADGVVDAIARAAHTGLAGDGHIRVWPLTRLVRVRTFTGSRGAS